MLDKKAVEQRISARPDVQGGKPCIKSTRTPVYAILEALATGMSFEELKKEFAPLTDEDIRACIYYAAMISNEEEIYRQSA